MPFLILGVIIYKHTIISMNRDHLYYTLQPSYHNHQVWQNKICPYLVMIYFGSIEQ